MLIPLTEPTAPRYIYINTLTNRVHLMLPVVSGTGIGLDNTCKAVSSLQEFFGKSGSSKQVTALNALVHYKHALEFDLSVLTGDSALKQPKEERLEQINQYILAMEALQHGPVLNTLNGEFPAYPEPLKTLMQEEDTNLYSMYLRPTVQDVNLRSVKPVFSFNRKNNESGNPNSVFYQTLHDTYQTLTIEPQDAKARLITATLESEEAQNNDFEGMRQILVKKTQEQLGIDIAFTHTKLDVDPEFRDNLEGQPLTKDFIDNRMQFNATTEPAEYIDAFLGYGAPNIFDTVTESPFYSAKSAEELSIVTQFFLAVTNIYCASHAISPANFGRVLDESADLSAELVARVTSVQLGGGRIEDTLLECINEHTEAFQLNKSLTPEDMHIIKTKFSEHYAEIKDAPHFDEFSVLETNKPGLFVTHQGCICTDFSEFANFPQLAIDSPYFQTIREDYKTINQTGTIPHKNEHIAASVEVNLEAMNEKQLDDLLNNLPIKTQLQMLKTMPALQLRNVLNHVARGEQAELELLLQSSPEAAPQLLFAAGAFTDYSGRTFNCTAYEYAYWAKDTHMCRMLEAHMDENTKAAMLVKVIAIDTVGLTYDQHGRDVEHSTHFDMTPLKTALQNYVKGYHAWDAANNYDAMKAAWMLVGLAQRDLPVHVINEYCRPDRSFHPLPAFNEDKLPRILTYYNIYMGSDVPLFPLVVSGSSGLGSDFALARASARVGFAGRPSERAGPEGARAAAEDVAAVSCLDEVRTADLKLSRTNLGLIEPELDDGCRL